MAELVNYIGVKQVKGTPMTVADPAQYPSMNGQPVGAEGYEVTYEDGYKSWSPKATFEAAYRPTSGMSAALAIEALNQGKKVSRHGWGNTEIHIVRSAEPDTVQYPEKDEDGNPFTPDEQMLREDALCRYDMSMDAGANVVHDWLPSHIDLQSDDWFIVEETPAE